MNSSIPESTQMLLQSCIATTKSRLDFWIEFIHGAQIRRMVEIGVYQGELACALLEKCPDVSKYYMIDPWKHLSDWNKPANQDDGSFEQMFQQVQSKTEFARARRAILRGKTTEVIDQISDRELDFAYIDGDHTLRGVSIDLTRVYPKVRPGGFIGGDDFNRTIWAHKTSFEPTMVFPYAVYFAEAVGATMFALPYAQFCLQKTEQPQFRFVDLTGHYDEFSVRSHVEPGKMVKLYLGEKFPRLLQAFRKLRGSGA